MTVIMAVSFFLTACVFCATVIYLKQMDQEFSIRQSRNEKITVIAAELELKLEELDNLKQRVDALTFKSGFKL